MRHEPRILDRHFPRRKSVVPELRMKFENCKISNLIFSIPANWTVEYGETTTTIVDPTDGVGALQFSVFIVPNPNAIVPEDELRYLLKDRHDNINFTASKSYVEGTCFDRKIDSFWKYWLLLKEDRVFFVSYNCEIEDASKEILIVSQIIASAFT